jgi:hypothetical protein
MYPIDINALLAQMIIEDRIREASRSRPARELQRHERPSTSAAPAPRRHSRLWTLVHFRHAYS